MQPILVLVVPKGVFILRNGRTSNFKLLYNVLILLNIAFSDSGCTHLFNNRSISNKLLNLTKKGATPLLDNYIHANMKKSFLQIRRNGLRVF